MTFLLFALLASVPGSAPASLHFTAPDGWTSKSSSSTMRVAEFVLSKASGDNEDASLVVYFFGGQGGSVQANIDRWIGQMVQADGKASKAVAKTRTLSVNGLAISVVDVSGTYTAEMSPGSADHLNKPGFRLEAAVVETAGGPYFIKLIGPAKTIARWDGSFTTFLHTLRYE